MADITHAGGMSKPERFQPAGQRLITLDALRGFAILGILVPNIYFFAWPWFASAYPSFLGESAWNERAATINATVFLGKFMFNFALLFGAGVVLFDRKTEPPGGMWCADCKYSLDGLGEFAPCPECGCSRRAGRLPRLTDGWGLWYRRCGALFVIGMLHAYFFWFGDILVTYAMAGLTLVWWVRKLNGHLQMWGGLGLYVFGALINIGFMAIGIWAVEHGHHPLEEMVPPPGPEIEAYRGTWLDALVFRASSTVFLQVFMALYLPAICGMMVLGMGMTKLGWLTGQRSTRQHAALCVSMLMLGAATTALGFVTVQQLETAVPPLFTWQAVAQLVGVPLAIGYNQMIVLMCRARALDFVTRGLANVGRMALSNYLSQTLICTTLFYGYGFGLFAEIPFPHLYGVVVGVWCFNFAFSALWLRYFRYGPAEWVWRQITYLGLKSA